jgi:hypothetical protein
MTPPPQKTKTNMNLHHHGSFKSHVHLLLGSLRLFLTETILPRSGQVLLLLVGFLLSQQKRSALNHCAK